MSASASVPYVEPWLRGTYADIPAVGRAVLHAFDLALDDITKWTEGLTNLEVHAQPLGLSSVSFHLKHTARSIDRLLTYAEGGQISSAQLALLKTEQTGCRDACGIAGRGGDCLQQRVGSRARAGHRRLQHLSRSRPQATTNLHRWSTRPRGRPHPAPRRPGGDHVESDQSTAS